MKKRFLVGTLHLYPREMPEMLVIQCADDQVGLLGAGGYQAIKKAAPVAKVIAGRFVTTQEINQNGSIYQARNLRHPVSFLCAGGGFEQKQPGRRLRGGWPIFQRRCACLARLSEQAFADEIAKIR